jgi:FkbM family methyltransferase
LIKCGATCARAGFRFGWLFGLRLVVSEIRFWCARRDCLVEFPAPKTDVRLLLRARTTDDEVFRQVFVDEQYSFNSGKPRFILDCGAYTGLSAVYFATRYAGVTVLAVEPEEQNFELLKVNTNRFANIRCVRAAVWDHECLVRIVDPNAGEWGYLVEELPSNEAGAVRARTIDGLLQDSSFEYIDVLKMDIEGAEKRVFGETCHSWLAKTQVLMVELHDHSVKGASQAFFKALVQYPFNSYQNFETTIIDKREGTTR